MMVMTTAATVAALIWLAVRPSAGQPTAYRAPRTADGKPNLNGISTPSVAFATSRRLPQKPRRRGN